MSSGWNYHDWLTLMNIFLLGLGMSHFPGVQEAPELKQAMTVGKATNIPPMLVLCLRSRVATSLASPDLLLS